MPTDAELRDAAVAELQLTTAGWRKPNGNPNYPSGVAPATTHWGKAMALLDKIGAAPVPPDPVPPTGNVKRLDRLTDWQGIQNLYVRAAGGGWFSPTATSPPNVKWPDGGGVFQLSDGMRFVATDKMTAPWADTSKLAIGAWDMAPSTFNLKHQVWEGEIEFPSADNPKGWPMVLSPWSASVLAEWETDAGSVGHQLQIDDDGDGLVGDLPVHSALSLHLLPLREPRSVRHADSDSLRVEVDERDRRVYEGRHRWEEAR